MISPRPGVKGGVEAWRHAHESERYWLRETASVWFWGAVLPLLALGSAPVSRRLSVLLLAGYPALVARIFLRMRGKQNCYRDAALYATFCVLGKFAQVQGATEFLRRRVTGAAGSPMEYRAR